MNGSKSATSGGERASDHCSVQTEKSLSLDQHCTALHRITRTCPTDLPAIQIFRESPMPTPLIRDALNEPREFVPTLARRLGAALLGPPLSFAKNIGPSAAPRGVPRYRPPPLTQRSAPQRTRTRLWPTPKTSVSGVSTSRSSVAPLRRPPPLTVRRLP